MVQTGVPIFTVIGDREFWVDANFKETELRRIRPGQKATIVVDMYKDHAFKGEVASLSGGAGQAFSLLPAQNATGNWVKVTQRVPVRVRLLDPDAALPLRIGTTATVAYRRAGIGAPCSARYFSATTVRSEGRRALRQGADVAMAMKSHAYLLAICNNMLSTAVPEGITPELVRCEEETAQALLNEGVSWLREHGVPAEGQLVFGNPMVHIPEVANRIGADLIVMGHRYRRPPRAAGGAKTKNPRCCTRFPAASWWRWIIPAS